MNHKFNEGDKIRYLGEIYCMASKDPSALEYAEEDELDENTVYIVSSSFIYDGMSFVDIEELGCNHPADIFELVK
jgi:hypothetical protein